MSGTQFNVKYFLFSMRFHIKEWTGESDFKTVMWTRIGLLFRPNKNKGYSNICVGTGKLKKKQISIPAQILPSPSKPRLHSQS